MKQLVCFSLMKQHPEPPQQPCGESGVRHFPVERVIIKTDLHQYRTQVQRGLTMSSKVTCQVKSQEKTRVPFIKETKKGGPKE